MTACHPEGVTVGWTHASSVKELARLSVEESCTVTQLFVPLNESAFPYFPAVVQTALVMVPLLLFPEASFTAVPVPSLKLYAATSPFAGGGVVLLETVTVTDAVDLFPAASRAIALRVCEPLATVVVFHETEYGEAVSSAPRAAPSSWN